MKLMIEDKKLRDALGQAIHMYLEEEAKAGRADAPGYDTLETIQLRLWQGHAEYDNLDLLDLGLLYNAALNNSVLVEAVIDEPGACDMLEAFAARLDKLTLGTIYFQTPKKAK